MRLADLDAYTNLSLSESDVIAMDKDSGDVYAIIGVLHDKDGGIILELRFQDV